VEFLMTLAVISVVVAIAAPGLSGARSAARQAACAAQLHHVSIALGVYTAESRNHLPPFLFSDSGSPNLPLSGHYGGAESGSLFRAGDRDVNLHALRRQGMIRESQLMCPGASAALQDGRAGYFPKGRFSTYGLRMPYSLDIWPTRTPPHPDWDALTVYLHAAGGQTKTMFSVEVTSPQLRMDYQYSECPSGGVFDPSADAIVSDMFIDQDTRAAGAVERRWCHGRRFNVLLGGGAVRLVEDDGTVLAYSSPPGAISAMYGEYNALRAERVWQFFTATARGEKP